MINKKEGTSRAVVTGGAGFIGSHLVDELIGRGVETFVLDNLSSGSLENLKQHRGNELLHVIVGDAWMIERLFADVSDIQVVFHEAAIASVPKSVKEPMLVHEVNVDTALKVMNFCVKRKVKRFIFASSAAVYGILGNRRATEQMLCAPSSPYGASKMAIEDYLHAYHTTYGLETVMLRYFNVYGPRQALSEYSGVITVFIDKLLKNEPLTVFGDGEQVRDFVNVRDIVQANMLAMGSPDAVGDVFNVASGQTTSILQLIHLLEEASNSGRLEYTFAPSRVGDVKFGVADIEKIKKVLRYERKVSMKDGLAELIDDFRSKRAIEVMQK
jgi:UDP-glucose 4-epimerase